MSTPDELTQAVLAELAGIESPRLRQIKGAAVQHLHAFAREVQLSEAADRRQGRQRGLAHKAGRAASTACRCGLPSA